MSFAAMEGSRSRSRRGSKNRLFDVGKWAILFLLLFLLKFAAGQQQQQTLLGTDRSALLDLRSSLGIQTKDWPIKANPCTNWTGIACQDGRVTGINISGFKRTRLGRQNPRFAVDALGNFTQLTSFNASGFLLPGPIPDWLGSRVSSLESLDLRSCSVTGSIPSSLGSLSRLKTLYLSDNSLTGSIDSSLGQLTELSALNLSGNLLTGSIPDAFSTLARLTILDLSSNFISGSIPPSLGSISDLRVLNLSDNGLTSSFPVHLSNLSMLTHLELSKNSISGFLPAELSGLTSLQVLRIGSNDLSGQLPNNLFSALSRLEVLDVSGNNFTGEFPRISSKRENGSAVFNFSNNTFYGTLNSSLLEFSGSLDLSGNYFQGNVSANGGGGYNVSLERNCLQIVQTQRSLLDCREFYAKIGLVFDDFGTQPSDPPLPNNTARKNGRRLWVYILIGIGGGLVFILLLVLVIVFLLRRFRRGESSRQRARNVDVGPVTEGESATIPKEPSIVPRVGDSFTYEQMLRATCDFNDSNLIKKGHSGDLYLGLLDGWAPVVIKRIQGTGSGPLTGKKESYAVELEFFGRASHVRLIPLLGHCLELEQEKFLVYKYMPNGDLASSFFRATESEDGSFQSLDWITRLKIAIGAAEGLTYLHHECSPPLVHRDVQASSILLDDKFEVRLGSLSEVHAQEGDGHHNVIARLLRKPQTSEQGPSGPSTATCAFDVFCFGKILLELITGKIGIGQSDDATSKDWLEQTLPFISSFDKEPVTKIVDPSLIVDEDLLEEVWAMAIVAKSCLNPKPSKRPPIKHILKALENPLKVVREGSNSGSSSRLRNSSMRSWSTGFFGSWRQSSSGSAANPGHFNSGFKQSGRMGSQSSGGNDHSSSHKRASSEIFPEPVTITDMETLDGH